MCVFQDLSLCVRVHGTLYCMCQREQTEHSYSTLHQRLEQCFFILVAHTRISIPAYTRPTICPDLSLYILHFVFRKDTQVMLLQQTQTQHVAVCALSHTLQWIIYLCSHTYRTVDKQKPRTRTIALCHSVQTYVPEKIDGMH